MPPKASTKQSPHETAPSLYIEGFITPDKHLLHHTNTDSFLQ